MLDVAKVPAESRLHNEKSTLNKDQQKLKIKVPPLAPMKGLLRPLYLG